MEPPDFKREKAELILWGLLAGLILLSVVLIIVWNSIFPTQIDRQSQIFVDKAAPATIVGLVVDPKFKVMEVIPASAAGQAVTITLIRNSQKLIVKVTPSALTANGTGPTPTAVPQNYGYL